MRKLFDLLMLLSVFAATGVAVYDLAAWEEGRPSSEEVMVEYLSR